MRFLALTFLLAAVAAHAADVPKSPAPDSLASILAKRLAAEEKPACVAVGIVAATTQVAFGCTKAAGPVKIDRDSVFEIGSISKAFTGVLLAQMIERGEVSLADPASKYAPPGAKLPTRNGKEIRLRDLVTHTAGLPRLPPGYAPRNLADPYADLDEKTLYEALAQTVLSHDIGTKQVYSNFGFLWLSDLLGRRAGKPWDQLVDERILQPLFLASTGVRLGEDATARLVPGHSRDYAVVPWWTIPPSLAGVGGLRSSLLDMLRFAEAASGRRETPLAKAFALSFTKLEDVKDGTSTAFAWGERDRRVGRVYFHNGGTGGHSAMLAVNPDNRTAAVVLVDAATSFDDLALHLIDPTLPMRQKREAIAMPPAKMDEYAATYEFTPSFSIRIYRDGARLMAQATGQPAFQVFPEAPDRFFLTAVEAQMSFQRGTNGAIESMVLHQGGRDLPARRLP